MKVFKGCTADLESTHGSPGRFRLEIGVKMTEGASQCRRTGFHASEYVFDCLSFYPLGSGNRYFLAEAGGDIDETDGNAHVACTELTLIRELSVREVALEGMLYMVCHPYREWKANGRMLQVREDRAEAMEEGGIAIARGQAPMVRGCAGAVLGLLAEPEPGLIEGAKLFVVKGDIRPGKWYRLGKNGLEETEAGRDEV